jgi:hypothetical protein
MDTTNTCRALDQFVDAKPGGALPPKVGHILRLADVIREVDGSHSLGAAALAEAILSHPGCPLRPAE